MPLRLSAYLLHQQLDLGGLLVQTRQILGQRAADVAQAPNGARPGNGHQSSGIRIQPCFMA